MAQEPARTKSRRGAGKGAGWGACGWWDLPELPMGDAGPKNQSPSQQLEPEAFPRLCLGYTWVVRLTFAECLRQQSHSSQASCPGLLGRVEMPLRMILPCVHSQALLPSWPRNCSKALPHGYPEHWVTLSWQLLRQFSLASTLTFSEKWFPCRGNTIRPPTSLTLGGR